MAKISKIHVQKPLSTSGREQRFDFAFSDDIEKWIHGPKIARAERAGQANDGRRRHKTKWA